jgi:hypothetical protein
MQLLDDASEKPILLVENQVRQPAEILPYASNLKSKLSWQARLKNCKSMMLLISKPDAIATTKSLGTAYSGQEVSRLSNLTKDGTIQLPPLNLPLGLSQIQVIALDEQGQRMGLPSEPVTISR